MNLQLRTATAADLAAIRDVYRRASLSNDGDRETLLAHPDALEFTGDGIADGRTRVAVDAGRVVGFATLAPPHDDAVELDDLFVDPEWMRRGIGRRLVADLVLAARDAGAARIDVTANPDALAFYAAVGFVAVGEATTRFGPAPTMSFDLRDLGTDRA